MSPELTEPTNEKSIKGVATSLFSHPIKNVVLRWNWKAGFLSALLRAPIFFGAYLKGGINGAIGAALVQSVFRIIFGGVNGSIIQSFSKVEPAWQATLTVPLVLAAFSHLMEFVTQSVYDHYTGTTAKGKAIIVSVTISIISAVFNLFAMRRGALLVKDERAKPLWRDMVRMPLIVLEFIFFPAIWVWSKLRPESEIV